VDVMVEDIEAELWARQLGSGRGGAAGRVRRSAASSPRTMAGAMWSAGGVKGASEASRWYVVT